MSAYSCTHFGVNFVANLSPSDYQVAMSMAAVSHADEHFWSTDFLGGCSVP